MRALVFAVLILLSICASAFDTLRVGTQLLSVGDSAIRAMDLLGEPDFKEPVENAYGSYRGERWQFHRDNGRVLTIVILHAKVCSIDDSPL